MAPAVRRAVQGHYTLARPREHQDHSASKSNPTLDEKKALARKKPADTTMHRLWGGTHACGSYGRITMRRQYRGRFPSELVWYRGSHAIYA